MPRIHDVRISTSGHRALTVGVDATIRVWNTFSGEPLGSIRPDPCCLDLADLSPDGNRVVWAGCPGFRAYDVRIA